MTILAATCWPQVPPERLRTVARAAEDCGLAELWLWEDCFWGGAMSLASALLAWTDRLPVGIGVLPVPLRNVALTAMEVAALHRLFPGRVTVGVGHGVQGWMGQVGARVESPVTLLGEYLQALRGLLRGERLTVDGRYVSRRRGRPRGRGSRPCLDGGRGGQGRAPPRPRRPGPGGLRQVRRRAGAAAARVTRRTRPLRTGRTRRLAGRARPARRAPR